MARVCSMDMNSVSMPAVKAQVSTTCVAVRVDDANRLAVPEIGGLAAAGGNGVHRLVPSDQMASC